MAWTLVFSDNWTGTDSDPWDSGKWTVATRDSSLADIQDNRGRMVAQGGNYRWVRAASTMTAIGTTRVEGAVEFDSVAEQFAVIAVNHGGTWDTDIPLNSYFIDIDPNATWAANEIVLWVESSGLTQLASAAFTFSISTVYQFIFERDVSTNVLRFKIWDSGTTEPGDWLISTTDSTHTSGIASLRQTNGGGGAGARTVFWNDFEVYEEGVAPITADIDHGLSRTYSHKLDATLGSLPAVTVNIDHGITRTYSHKIEATLGAIPGITGSISHGVSRSYEHSLNATVGVPLAVSVDVDHGISRAYSHAMNVTLGTPPAITGDIAHGLSRTYSHKLMTLGVEVLPFGVRPGPTATMAVANGLTATFAPSSGPSVTGFRVRPGPSTPDA